MRPSARRLDRIAAATGGQVSVYAMHCKRLEWERAQGRAGVVESVTATVV